MSDYDGYITLGTDLDLSGVEKKLDQMITLMEKKSEKAGEEASAKMSKKLAAGMTVGISVLTNVVNRLMNVIGNSMDKAISRVDILNNFPRVMGSLGISSDDAAQSIEYLSDKLVGLPTTLDEGAKAVQRFTSANRNVKASTEMYLALNNAILAGGTAPQQQAIAMEQMSQAYAKGKMDYKEWLAIMQTAPAQMRQVGEAMGYTNIEKFGEDLRRGKISMNDFMKTLVTMNKSSVNGFKTLEEQAREGTGGIRTTLTNLKTTIVRSVGEIMQTIGQKNIARFFQSITDTIKALIPYIAAFTKSFMNMISAIVSVIGKIGKAIGSLFGKKAKKNADETSASLGEVSYAVGDIGENAQDSASSAKKLAKELDNLQGFDEMNVLQDKTDTGGSGGTADVDVGGLEALEGLGDFGTDFGEKIKQLTLNVDAFVAALWGIIAAITAFKTLKLLEALGLISLPLATIVKIAAGIGLIVAGIILVVKGVIDYLKDPTWENFGKILAGIALIVAGVALIFGGIPALITAIILAVAALGLAIYKNWDKIKATLSKVGKWINDNVIKPVVNFFKGLWKDIENGFNKVINNIKSLLKTIGSTVGNVVGGAFKAVVNGVLRTVENVLNTPIRTINSLINTINKLPGVSMGKLSTFSLPRLAKGGIVNNPGPGVMMGGYIAGEKGPEAVLPLTDDTLQRLANMIPITVNVTNSMNGRVLSREIQRVQNENNFALNR